MWSCGVTKCTYVQIISCGDGDEQVVCDKINKCIFCKLCSLVEINEDLKRFAQVLSSVQHIKLDTNWNCLWNKMPLKWLLNENRTYELDSISSVSRYMINDGNVFGGIKVRLI